MTTSDHKDMALTVLLLEDNDREALLVRQTLEAGWLAAVTIHRYLKVQDIISYLNHKTPDIILTDLNVLDSEGLDTVEAVVRANHSKVPIVVATSMKDQKKAVRALEMGAQEYVVKGEYSAESLAAAIRFARARTQSMGQTVLIKDSDELGLDGLSIDLMGQAIIHHDGQQNHKIELSPMELKLGAYFMKHVVQVLSRDELRKNIWGDEVSISDRVIDNQVSRLRAKIKTTNYSIQSVRGVGYKLVHDGEGA